MPQPLYDTLLSQYRPSEIYIDCDGCRRRVTVATAILAKKYGNPPLGVVACMVARAAQPPCALAEDPLQQLCRARPLEVPFHHWATLVQANQEGWTALLNCHRHFAAMKSTKPCREAIELDLETLIAILGHDFPLERLPRRLQCSHCGTESVEVQWIEPKAAPPPGGTTQRPPTPVQLRPKGVRDGPARLRVITRRALRGAS